tara:strand:+ start:4088 stop:4354 length:267 start_codon:yes stop_codon:yes gene_type:complete
MSSIETVDNISSGDRRRMVATFYVSSFTTNGSGTGAVFRIVIDDDGTATITVITKGSGYATNDTITIPDSELGRCGGVPLTFNVNEVS